MQEGIRLGEKTEVKKELGRSHLICADSTDRIVGQVGRDALVIESEAVQNCLGVQMRDESLHIRIFCGSSRVLTALLQALRKESQAEFEFDNLALWCMVYYVLFL